MEHKYGKIEMIGAGTFGYIYKARDLATGEELLIKRIRFEGEDEGVVSEIMREVSHLKELQHEHIVRLFDVQIGGKEDGLVQNEVNLIFEYLEYDFAMFRCKNPITARNPLFIKKFLHQILCGVAYCHSLKIIHQDLRPRNLLMNTSGDIVKISDFGLARAIGVPPETYTRKVETLWYMAPEIMFRTSRDSTPVDLWSVGCIFAEMVKGRPLFRVDPRWCMLHDCLEDRVPAQLLAIFSLMGTPNEETWPGVTSLYPKIGDWDKHLPKDLAELLPSLEPAGIDLLSKLLCLDPSRRITAHEALQHAFFNGIGNVA